MVESLADQRVVKSSDSCPSEIFLRGSFPPCFYQFWGEPAQREEREGEKPVSRRVRGLLLLHSRRVRGKKGKG